VTRFIKSNFFQQQNESSIESFNTDETIAERGKE